MPGPITPDEASVAAAVQIPEVVFEVFNDLIAKKLGSGKSATVLQNEVVERLVAKGLSSSEIFKNHWLDVETSYQAAGWEVAFDQPAYCESYKAYFTFTRP